MGRNLPIWMSWWKKWGFVFVFLFMDLPSLARSCVFCGLSPSSFTKAPACSFRLSSHSAVWFDILMKSAYWKERECFCCSSVFKRAMRNFGGWRAANPVRRIFLIRVLLPKLKAWILQRVLIDEEHARGVCLIFFRQTATAFDAFCV